METRFTSASSVWVFALLGLILVVGPWTSAWTAAAISLLPRWIAGWALSGWARGLVSGLGGLDLSLALWLGVGSRKDKKKAASMMPPAERVPRAAQGEERSSE